jgi:hypothetical protein
MFRAEIVRQAHECKRWALSALDWCIYPALVLPPLLFSTDYLSRDQQRLSGHCPCARSPGSKSSEINADVCLRLSGGACKDLLCHHIVSLLRLFPQHHLITKCPAATWHVCHRAFSKASTPFLCPSLCLFQNYSRNNYMVCLWPRERCIRRTPCFRNYYTIGPMVCLLQSHYITLICLPLLALPKVALYPRMLCLGTLER